MMNEFFQKFLREFSQALGFLTRIPAGRAFSHDPELAGAAVTWYGCTGILCGLLLMIFAAILQSWMVVPAELAAVLTLALWVGITGALHIDGLADCGDAWMGGFTRQRFLEIMRDTHCGVGAIVFPVLVLIIKAIALIMLFGQGALFGQGVLLAVLFPPAIARITLSIAIVRFPYVRESGSGSDLARSLDPRAILFTGIAVCLLLCVISWPGFVVSVIGSALGFALVWWTLVRKAGGFTGDIYGALVEICEAAVLVSLTTLPMINSGPDWYE